MTTFQGAGGGGGSKGSPQPVNTKDTLRSADRIEVILGLCEGPIRGLYQNSQTNFRIGDTRIRNSDGTYNFPLFSLDIGLGDSPGDVITPILGGYEDYRKLNASLVASTPYLFVTTYKGIRQVVLRLQVDQLYRRGRQTNLPPGVAAAETDLPNTMVFAIAHRPASGGAWVNPFPTETISVSGNTRTGQIHEIRFLVDPVDDQLEVSVNLLTPDLSGAPCKVKIQGFYEVTPGVFGSTKTTSVNTTMGPSLPVVRTTDYPPKRKDGTYGIDVIDLRIMIDALYYQDTESGVFEETVSFLVEAKPTSSSSWQRPFQSDSNPSGEITLYDKTTSPTLFELRFPVTPITESYDIRLTRTSPDDSGAGRIRSIRWESFQEIVGGTLQFDSVATAHLVGEITDQLSAFPDLWGVYDALIMRVPTNYDPDARTYDGTWDGIWKLDWTNNGALFVHELVMNESWGAKAYRPNISMDRYEVYECAQYCDVMVPDGRGGLQPRYTFNAVIGDAKPSKEFLRFVAGTFNAVLIDELNGQVRLKMARADREPVALFAPENIIGMFEYATTDITSQYNHITVAFDNEETDFETDFRIIYDQDHINRYGKVPLEFAAFGCTNPQEAIRRAAYKLVTATTEDCLLTFQTNRIGLFLEPLDVILIADPDMDYGMSSRINRVEDRLVYLHEPVFLEPGINYTASFTVVDEEAGRFKTISIPIVADVSGLTYIFTLGDPPPQLAEDAVVSVGASDAGSGTPQPFLVVSIEDGETAEVCKITCTNVNRLKQEIADNATDRFGFDLLNYPADIGPPSALRVLTETFAMNNEVVPVMVVLFSPSEDPRSLRHEVQIKVTGTADSEWKTAGTSRTGRVDVLHIADGVYDVRVRAIAMGARFSQWVTILGQGAGLDIPPSDVNGLFATLVGNSFDLSWSAVPDRDLSHYTMRFVPDDVVGTPEELWMRSIEVVEATKSTTVRVPALVGKYMVKAVDLSGRESQTPAITGSASTGFGLNAVMEIDSLAPFSEGTALNMTYDSGSLLLKLDPGEEEGSYTLETGPLGGSGIDPTTCRVSAYLYASAERDDFMMSDWATLAEVETLSGVAPGTWEVELQINCHDGGGWRAFAPGDWTGTEFGLRVVFRRFVAIVTPVLIRVRWVIDTPDRTERGSLGISTTTNILFARPFLATPVLSVTIRNQQTGDYLEIDKDEFGFEVTARNSAGTAVTRQIDWIAVGYGGA